MNIESIYAPVSHELQTVSKNLDALVDIDFPWLSETIKYTFEGSGKRLRPLLVLLSGKFGNYNLDRLLPMGASVELMHTATLVHDDTIDKSDMRRGRATVYKKIGEEKAVLFGDYLFAKAGEMATMTGNVEVIMLFCQTLERIASGELKQALNAYNWKQSMSDYLDRIIGKTASLFELSTVSGGILSDLPRDSVKSLKDYGRNLGIAFQIVDDILDFNGSELELGKPVGSDLTQGTFTLPAMLFLNKYPGDNPLNLLSADPANPDNEKQRYILKIISSIRDSSIISECYLEADKYARNAIASLNNIPDGEIRRVLSELVEFVIKRRK